MVKNARLASANASSFIGHESSLIAHRKYVRWKRLVICQNPQALVLSIMDQDVNL